MNKKTMNILLIIIGVGLVVWFLYSWIPVLNIEEPTYAVVSSTRDYEIREYSPYIIAETTITGARDRGDAAQKGFPIIAGYIFGNNTKKDKIAMTVPVNTEPGVSEKIAMTVPVNTEEEDESGAYKVSFVMPSEYTLETLPTPNDTRVFLREVPSRTIAVRTFSWTTSDSAFRKNEAKLLEALARDEVETVGSVNVARYNTPWTIPFMLRNEVQVEVR